MSRRSWGIIKAFYANQQIRFAAIVALVNAMD
jgi:hypothetical protein